MRKILAAALMIMFFLQLAGISTVTATDPVISFDFRDGSIIQMTTWVYRIPESVPDKDLYGIKIWINGKVGLRHFGFSVATTGTCHLIKPTTGFTGGGFSLGYGGGLSISGSVPISITVASGVGTSQATCKVGAIFPSWSCDFYSEWHVPEGASFDWSVEGTGGTIAYAYGLWVFVSETLVWDPSSIVRPPVSSVFAKRLNTDPTVTFNASLSRGGNDGDTECPITSYEWDFGDGTTLTTTYPVVQHTYPGNGMYKVELTVRAPGQGWVSSDYVSHSTSGTVVEIISPTMNIDAFVIIENWNTYPFELESRFITGVGQNNSYGAHARNSNSIVWLYALVTDVDGEPVEGAGVHFSLVGPYGGTIDLGTHATNASGIAVIYWIFTEGQPCPYPAGIYWFVAEYAGHEDAAGFSYKVCLLMIGRTLDGYTVYIEYAQVYPEGTLVTITANPPAPYTLRCWNINFFNESDSNPLSIEMDRDYLVVGYYVVNDFTPPTNPTSWSGSHSVGVWSSDNSIYIEWWGASDPQSGVYGYSYTWDTSPSTIPDTTVDTTGTSATSPFLADGNSWYFHVRTRNNAGKWNPDAFHVGPFCIDRTAPSASITNPTDGEMVSGTVLITASASDATSGIQKVEFYIDGVLKKTDTISPYQCYWDTTLEKTSLHIIKALAYDYANNKKYDQITVYIDRHDVAVTKVMPTVTVNSYVLEIYGAYPTWLVNSLNIIVTVKNEGSYTETFDVTAYCNGEPIGTQSVTLSPMGTPAAEINLTFPWSLPSLPGYPNNKSQAWPYPTYTFSAEASVVPGETDTTDNTYTDGVVKMKWPGDANGDGHINVIDQGMLGYSWLTKVGDEKYNPRVDFNMDGKVNVIDLGTLGNWWLKGPLD